jgi:hypothetical protein
MKICEVEKDTYFWSFNWHIKPVYYIRQYRCRAHQRGDVEEITGVAWQNLLASSSKAKFYRDVTCISRF